jgi:uncharacterized protein YcfJ
MTTTTHRIGRTLGAGLAGLALLVGASGCNNAGEGAVSGAALGALSGLAIGSLSGDAGKGAIIGTVAGAVGGAVLGDQNERNNRNSSPAVYSTTPPSRTSYDDCGRCDTDHYSYSPKMSRQPDAVYEHHHYHHD